MGKKDKTPKQKLYAYLLLDRSASMGSCWIGAMAGLNGYAEELKSSAKGTITVDVFDQYNTGMDLHRLRDGVKIKNFVELSDEEVSPRGATPLHDAVATLIKRVMQSHEANERVAITIMTDGQENASVEYTSADVTRLVNECKARGWLVNYLGANQDAISVGAAMGIDVGNAMTYDVRNISSVGGASAARSTMSYAGAATATAGLEKSAFTDEERERAVK